MPAVRVDAGEQHDLEVLDDAADVLGRKSLAAIAQPGAAGVRLQEIGGEIDQRVGRHPFAGVQAAGEADRVGAVGVGGADAQRVRLPALRGPVRQQDQFGHARMRRRERFEGRLDLVDIHVGHGATP